MYYRNNHFTMFQILLDSKPPLMRFYLKSLYPDPTLAIPFIIRFDECANIKKSIFHQSATNA